MATKIKKNIEKGKKSVWFSGGEGCWGIEYMGGLTPETTGPSPGPSPEGRGVICEVTPIGLLTRFLGSSFSHRAHRANRAYLRTVSIPQKASGIQRSQRLFN